MFLVNTNKKISRQWKSVQATSCYLIESLQFLAWTQAMLPIGYSSSNSTHISWFHAYKRHRICPRHCLAISILCKMKKDTYHLTWAGMQEIVVAGCFVSHTSRVTFIYLFTDSHSQGPSDDRISWRYVEVLCCIIPKQMSVSWANIVTTWCKPAQCRFQPPTMIPTIKSDNRYGNLILSLSWSLTELKGAGWTCIVALVILG